MGDKNRKRLSGRKVYDFFACLAVVVVILAGQPHFFIGATVGFAIGKVVGLVIGGVVLMETDIAVNFSGLFLY